MPNKHNAGCKCCNPPNACTELSIVDLAKATGIEGMTLRVVLPLEDRSYTLDFNSTTVQPNLGNMPGNPKAIYALTPIEITYVPADSAVASEPDGGIGYFFGGLFAGFGSGGFANFTDPAINDTDYILAKIGPLDVETTAITGAHHRFENSIKCDVALGLKVKYEVALVFECLDGDPVWYIQLSAKHKMAIAIELPAFAPSIFASQWPPFFIIEDYSDTMWMPDSWRPPGGPFATIPFGDIRTAPLVGKMSEGWQGSPLYRPDLSILAPFTLYQFGAFGDGGASDESNANASTKSLVPAFNPTGLLDFYAEII